jgi:SpoVK/Ycf46/Vps4 family AAA+-type ATPase
LYQVLIFLTDGSVQHYKKDTQIEAEMMIFRELSYKQIPFFYSENTPDVSTIYYGESKRVVGLAVKIQSEKFGTIQR